ncbi:alpha/beta fold hydrolase [Epibacterium ulvae]|uniref:Pimeloyl-ACP methyl ester carboxylesterase n=1 Tax=Epibacterium ulvae TaxID=1156985 RepID=A0A1G5QEZ3_9RHOB|nr:alpha/beta hydrolase [Epibacterium ulvae]SCZ59921.1 Pimeloyl-ACP methyl ester carboxylesterase [Epibacterium ulvae]
MYIRSLFLGAAVSALILPMAALAESAKTVVMVHGAFADGSSWNKVIPLLQEEGLKTIAVQLPMTSLADDVAFTQRAIDNAEGEVVLVGHSWGGVVITEAGVDDQVMSLVYLSAFAPIAGEHIHDILDDAHKTRGIPTVDGFKTPIVDENKFIRLSEETIVKYFAPDIPQADAKLIAASQGRLHAAALDQAPSVQAWDGKPSWYVVAANDQMIAPDVQREQAERIGAQTTEIAASHVGMLSKPEDVAAVIIDAAK